MLNQYSVYLTHPIRPTHLNSEVTFTIIFLIHVITSHVLGLCIANTMSEGEKIKNVLPSVAFTVRSCAHLPEILDLHTILY